MALQSRVLFPSFQIPKLRSLIHRPSGQQAFVGVKGYGDNFILVACKGVQTDSLVGVPELGGFVE